MKYRNTRGKFALYDYVIVTETLVYGVKDGVQRTTAWSIEDAEYFINAGLWEAIQ